MAKPTEQPPLPANLTAGVLTNIKENLKQNDQKANIKDTADDKNKQHVLQKTASTRTLPFIQIDFRQKRKRMSLSTMGMLDVIEPISLIHTSFYEMLEDGEAPKCIGSKVSISIFFQDEKNILHIFYL